MKIESPKIEKKKKTMSYIRSFGRLSRVISAGGKGPPTLQKEKSGQRAAAAAAGVLRT